MIALPCDRCAEPASRLVLVPDVDQPVAVLFACSGCLAPDGFAVALSRWEVAGWPAAFERAGRGQALELIGNRVYESQHLRRPAPRWRLDPTHAVPSRPRLEVIAPTA